MTSWYAGIVQTCIGIINDQTQLRRVDQAVWCGGLLNLEVIIKLYQFTNKAVHFLAQCRIVFQKLQRNVFGQPTKDTLHLSNQVWCKPVASMMGNRLFAFNL